MRTTSPRPSTTCKFRFTDDQQRGVRATGRSRIVIDHPEYQADVELTDEQRDELVGDFAA